MLTIDIFLKNLVAFVIDEAHCIKKWYVLCFNMYFIIFLVFFYVRGDSFRKEFSCLEESSDHQSYLEL